MFLVFLLCLSIELRAPQCIHSFMCLAFFFKSHALSLITLARICGYTDPNMCACASGCLLAIILKFISYRNSNRVFRFNDYARLFGHILLVHTRSCVWSPRRRSAERNSQRNAFDATQLNAYHIHKTKAFHSHCFFFFNLYYIFGRRRCFCGVFFWKPGNFSFPIN